MQLFLVCPGVVAVLLGMLCLGSVVGSMGAVVVSLWTSWRIFLRNFPPSVPFFPLPGWLSRNILLPLPSVSPHKLGPMWRAWMFHSIPAPWWLPPFRWAVSHNLRPCGPRIWPIFSYPVVAFFATSRSPWHTCPRSWWVYQLVTDDWFSKSGLIPGWLRGRVGLPLFLLAWLLLVALYSWARLGGSMLCQALGSSVFCIGAVGLPGCQLGACFRIPWLQVICCFSGMHGIQPLKKNC